MGGCNGLGDPIEQKTDTFCEESARWEEADDQPAVPVETEEVPGLDADPMLLEQLQAKIFFAEDQGNAQDRAPTAADGGEGHRRVT
jgi:hypothetical protein